MRFPPGDNFTYLTNFKLENTPKTDRTLGAKVRSIFSLFFNESSHTWCQLPLMLYVILCGANNPTGAL